MTISKKLKFTHPLGLHARPASTWVRAIGQYECEVRIYKGTLEANGRSAISLMLLQVVEGDELIVTMDGPDAIEAILCFEQWLERL